jgi:hypothetical protein
MIELSCSIRDSGSMTTCMRDVAVCTTFKARSNMATAPLLANTFEKIAIA